MHMLNTVSVLGETRQSSVVKMKAIPVRDPRRTDSQEANLALG